MNNGRENRTNGNEEEGEKEKEALRKFSVKSNRGTQIASPKFFAAYFAGGVLPRRCRIESQPLFSAEPRETARPAEATT